jgi:hypothetical protein
MKQINFIVVVMSLFLIDHLISPKILNEFNPISSFEYNDSKENNKKLYKCKKHQDKTICMYYIEHSSSDGVSYKEGNIKIKDKNSSTLDIKFDSSTDGIFYPHAVAISYFDIDSDGVDELFLSYNYANKHKSDIYKIVNNKYEKSSVSKASLFNKPYVIYIKSTLKANTDTIQNNFGIILVIVFLLFGTCIAFFVLHLV